MHKRWTIARTSSIEKEATCRRYYGELASALVSTSSVALLAVAYAALLIPDAILDPALSIALLSEELAGRCSRAPWESGWLAITIGPPPA